MTTFESTALDASRRLLAVSALKREHCSQRRSLVTEAVMALHLVVGAGPIGSGVAQLLADSGEQVRIVTRRGSGPEHPAIERVAADAADAARLRELAQGA